MNKICPCQVGYATHYIPLGRDISYNYIPEEASYCSYEFQQLGVAVATGHINIYADVTEYQKNTGGCLHMHGNDSSGNHVMCV